jgi:hypothetical protein
MDEEAEKSEQSRSQCLDACIKVYEYPERVSPCFTDCSNTSPKCVGANVMR